jgi:hypothetical protein
MFLQFQGGSVHMWVNCTVLATSQLHDLLTDARQSDIQQSGFWLAGGECNSIN